MHYCLHLFTKEPKNINQILAEYKEEKLESMVFDVNKEDITERNQVYSGCWCRFRIRLFAYNQAGQKGISCSLQALQKIEDDVRLDKNVKDFF